jgi:NADPH:quinone reductase-like Zn-dependent oxidoreductase
MIISSHVLITVHAVLLNWKDIAILAGKFPWPALENGSPAAEFAGEIIAVGENVEGFQVCCCIRAFCFSPTFNS